RLLKTAYNNGVIPNEYRNRNNNSDTGYIDTFSVLIDGAYNLIGIYAGRTDAISQDEYIDYANQAINSHEKTGEINNYAYLTEFKSYGKIIVFLDTSQYKHSEKNLLITSVIIGIVGIMLFIIISVILSFWLVRPVKENFEKQKRFISDASHELKTPLAVISANTDVLEGEIGENKWLSYIRLESKRMSELVNELLCLARLDDKSGHQLVMTQINLSDLVLSVSLPFESTVFEMGKKFDVDVQPDIMCKGDESSLKHIITILIDNAVKYSDEHGKISVKLHKQSNKNIIEVYNTGEGIKPENISKIFERFFRQDESRNSKTGGYGLGLPIAKSSVEAHGGKISVQSEYGKWAKFTVTLP
ncbi:MAG: GHKL domain-containing protein, partial [Clostridia bacterium]|nr:GHKL domain-containing protein [Clostridia bacterium]